MRKYCKAYHLKDLRRSAHWTEQHEENEQALSDDDVVYLWDDFTVVRSPIIADKSLLLDEVTPEWQAFCKEVLQFEVPEDLRYTYEEQAMELYDASETEVENQNKTSAQTGIKDELVSQRENCAIVERSYFYE